MSKHISHGIHVCITIRNMRLRARKKFKVELWPAHRWYFSFQENCRPLYCKSKVIHALEEFKFYKTTKTKNSQLLNDITSWKLLKAKTFEWQNLFEWKAPNIDKSFEDLKPALKANKLFDTVVRVLEEWGAMTHVRLAAMRNAEWYGRRAWFKIVCFTCVDIQGD